MWCIPQLCLVACKRDDTYAKVKEDILQTYVGVNEMISGGTFPSGQSKWDQYIDPSVPKKKQKFGNKVVVERRCSVCKQVGHTKPRCPAITRSMAEHTSAINNETIPHVSEGDMYDNSLWVVSACYLIHAGSVSFPRIKVHAK